MFSSGLNLDLRFDFSSTKSQSSTSFMLAAQFISHFDYKVYHFACIDRRFQDSSKL